MVFLLDHLTSVVISMAVVLVLFTVQMSAQRSSTEEALMYAAKRQTLSLGDILERDLVNIGYNRNPNHQRRILEHESAQYGPVKVTKKFSFWGMDETETHAPIRYTTQQVGTTTLDSTVLPLLQWKREICRSPDESDPVDNCASGAWKSDGGSPATLVRFDVEFPKSSGDVFDPSDVDALDEKARRIRVWMHNAVAPGVRGEYLKGHRLLYWRITLRPGGLRGSVSAAT